MAYFSVRVTDTHEQEAHAPLTAVSDADQQFGSGSRLLRSAEPTETCLPWWNATAQGAGGGSSPYVRSRIGVRALGLVVLSCSTGWIPVWAPTEPWGLAIGLASPRSPFPARLGVLRVDGVGPSCGSGCMGLPGPFIFWQDNKTREHGHGR